MHVCHSKLDITYFLESFPHNGLLTIILFIILFTLTPKGRLELGYSYLAKQEHIEKMKH